MLNALTQHVQTFFLVVTHNHYFITVFFFVNRDTKNQQCYHFKLKSFNKNIIYSHFRIKKTLYNSYQKHLSFLMAYKSKMLLCFYVISFWNTTNNL